MSIIRTCWGGVIGQEHASLGVDRDRAQLAKACRERGAAVAGARTTFDRGVIHAFAGNDVDRAIEPDLDETRVVPRDDHEATVGAPRKIDRVEERRLRGERACNCARVNAGARDRLERAVGGDDVKLVVVLVHHVDATVGTYLDGAHPVERRLDGELAVSAAAWSPEPATRQSSPTPSHVE